MEAAAFFFKNLIEEKQVDAYQVVLMMQAHFSHQKQQHILDAVLGQAGIKPTLGVFNTMIKQLIFDDKKSTAKDIVEKDMPAANINPDERTREYLSLSDAALNDLRSRCLLKLIVKGVSVGQETVWDIFQNLVRRKQATKDHFDLMMTKACQSSDQQQHLVDVHMPAAGVLPDVHTYNTLVSQLIIEGNEDSARKVAEKDMHAAGIKPDAQTWKPFGLQAEELDRMRSQHLANLVSHGHQDGYNAAWEFLEGLVARKKASRHHFNFMMAKACKSSDEQQYLLDTR